MPQSWGSDHFSAIIFAVLFGPAIFGLFLTILAAVAVHGRGNASLMLMLGWACSVIAHVAAYIGFVPLNEILRSEFIRELPGRTDVSWYFLCIAGGTVAMLGCAIYCWVRPSPDANAE